KQLIQQAAAVSEQETQLRQALLAGGADAQAISKELQTLREVTGAVPVHGPGLQIRILGPIMDFELQDLLNSLRSAGGEAFALNGSRMISSTPIASRGVVPSRCRPNRCGRQWLSRRWATTFGTRTLPSIACRIGPPRWLAWRLRCSSPVGRWAISAPC